MEDKVLLRIRNITKIFPGVKALDQVSLQVEVGEVHALVGENGAGKSTLVNIISGVLRPDSGEMTLDQRKYAPANPRESQILGIGFVHQEMALCPHLSIAENVFIGRLPRKLAALADFEKARVETGGLLKKFATDLDPKTKVQELTIANQQIVEIIKALSLDCRLLILDEPTSSLTEAETENLFQIITDLKSRGISILYISHRLSEVFQICDRISVLRDGGLVKTLAVADTSEDEVISQMVGRSIEAFYPAKHPNAGEEILRVEDLSCGKKFQHISFSVRGGEILGLSGLIGAGRSEVARALCGIDRYEKGQVYLDGKKIRFNNSYEAIQSKIAYLTENRKTEGLFLKLAIKTNIVVTSLKTITRRKLVDRGKEESLTRKYIEILRIKTAGLQQKVLNLSGGNQQKVMVAKWLAINPVVLFMDEPTRGIDVGAKTEIHYLMRELCNRGIGIVLISSELPEIIGMCDRVIVMNEGLKTGELVGEEITEENIMRLAAAKKNKIA